MAINFETLSDDEKSACLLDYVKGRLDEAARAQIDEIAAGSPDVREELEYYKGLARAAEVELDQEAAPGEMGWARLSREIAAEKAAASVPAAANDNGRWWRYAAMALALVVSGQFAAQFMPASEDQGADQRYIPASVQSTDTMVQVTFVPEASEASIRSLLNGAGANIVSGPSALGIYELGFMTEAARDAGLEALVGATDVVESAVAHR